MTQAISKTTFSSAQAGPRGLAAIILAAGKSTRMKSDTPKVLHDLCGRPMLAHVLDACRQADIGQFYIVVGFGKEQVVSALAKEPGVHFVEQLEQKGTGHAVAMCANAMAGFVGDCVVIAGDMPLIRAETLRTLVGGHRASGAAASIATTVLEDAAGYGRIVRGPGGAFEKIIEHRDCSEEQLAIREVNPSYYCFDAVALFAALPKLKAENAKREYYITDALTVLRGEGKTVRAATSVPAEDAMGINSRADLAQIAKLMQRRIQTALMESGVTIIDPDSTWIDCRAQIGAETVIRPFSYIGRARIGARCTIGPFAYVADGAALDDGTTAGPGGLTAFDTTAPARLAGPATTNKRTVQVARRPPTQTGCA